MAAAGPLRTGLYALALLLLCSLLAGCGTNVQWLLTEQDRLATAAEALGTGIEQPVYDAEDVQLEACHFLTEATVERMQKDPTFGEQFVSDLSVVFVLLVPVEPVERCATSLDAYRDSIAQLQRQLIRLGVVAGTPAEAEDSRLIRRHRA
jgi:hypothetical protein